MAEEGLKIKIGADVQSAVTSLNTLNTSLNKTTETAANVGASGMKSLTNETGKANIALVNFGRVVQDAPFGLIGIANNIDPLLTSFQSLKRETGSSGAAFRALVSSLTGPAGIAIAISSVTSLLIAFGPKISNFINGVSESEKALQDIAGSTAESFRKAQLEFEKLSNIITGSSSTYDQQKTALNEVNQSLSAYGLQIKNVSDFQKNAAQIGVLYAQIKQEEARGLALAAKSAEEYAKQIVAEALAKKATAQLSDNLKDLASNQGDVTNAFGILSSLLKNYNAESDKKTAVNNQKAYNSAINQSNTNLQNLLSQLDKIDGVTTTNKPSKAIKKTTKSAFDLTEELKNYRKELAGINWDEQNRGIDGTKKRLELAGETLRTLYLAGVKQTSSAWKEVSGNYEEFEKKFKQFLQAEELKKLQVFIQKYKEGIAELDIKQSITGQDQLNSRINLTIDALIELKKAGQENTAQYQELQNTLNNLKAEVGLREIRKRQQEIADIWQKYTLQANKLDFNQTRNSLDILKSKIDLIGNTIQELRSKGWTDQDLGLQVLGAQLNGLLDQFSKLKEQKEIFDTLRQTIEGGLTNAFGSVFEAIADGQDAFKALSDSIKRLVLDLIRAVIQMTIVKAIANALAPGVGGQAVDVVQKGVIRGDTLGFIIGRGTTG